MKTAVERYDEAIQKAHLQSNRWTLSLRRREHLIAAIEAAAAEERSRWLAWATDLGYDEQELPKDL